MIRRVEDKLTGRDFGKKTAGYPFWVAGIEHTVGNLEIHGKLEQMIAQLKSLEESSK